jgi:hypothetical protein
MPDSTLALQVFGHSADKTYVELRREPRLEANTPVTVTVLGMLGDPVTLGLVLDISGSGLRICLPSPLPCGAAVTVESDTVLVRADVCRCVEEGAGYTIGLELTEVQARS